MSAQDSAGGSNSAAQEAVDGGQDLTVFVQNLLSQMQSRFQTMSNAIIGRIDEMGSRIDDLEKSIGKLMIQSGLEKELDKSAKAPAPSQRRRSSHLTEEGKLQDEKDRETLAKSLFDHSINKDTLNRYVANFFNKPKVNERKLMYDVSEAGFIVAGGCILGEIFSCKYRDIDIFVPLSQQSNESLAKLILLIRRYKTTKRGKLMMKQGLQSVYFHGVGKLVNVIFANCESVVDVITSFDINPCRIGLYKGEIYQDKTFCLSIKLDNLYASPATAFRLAKYITYKKLEVERRLNAGDYAIVIRINNNNNSKILHRGDSAILFTFDRKGDERMFCLAHKKPADYDDTTFMSDALTVESDEKMISMLGKLPQIVRNTAYDFVVPVSSDDPIITCEDDCKNCSESTPSPSFLQ